MGSACSPGGIIFGDYFIESGTEIYEKIVFEIARAASQVSMVFLYEVSDFVKEGKELGSQPAKRLGDAKNDTFALGRRIPDFFVLFTRRRSKAGS